MPTPLGTPRHIVIHHTVTAPDADPADINRLHKSRFGGIGYHALVHQAAGGDWVVGDGRDDENIGAHTKGANTGSLGVAISGDYSHHPPPPGALGMVVGQCVAWCFQYGISPDEIYGHNGAGAIGGKTATVCPGMTPIPTIRRAVRAALRQLKRAA